MAGSISSPRRFAGMGACAGAVATVVFAVVHQLLINPIWFSLPAMLAAGVLCGACLAWSYERVAVAPSVRGWYAYNALYLLMFVALGVTSLAMYEPVTTIEALLKSREPPRDLIGQAMPVTAAFGLATAVVLTVLYRPRPVGALAILVTTASLLLLLGLNISILGFVEMPRSAVGVLIETFVLLAAIIGVYAVTLAALGWRSGDAA